MNKSTLPRHFVTLLLLVMITLFGLYSHAIAEPTPYEIAEQEFSKADEQLKAAYEDTLKSISRSDTRSNFIKAQQAWITFRDSEAEFRTSIGNKGGIVYAYGSIVVQTELTNDRIQQLKRFKKEIEDSNADQADEPR